MSECVHPDIFLCVETATVELYGNNSRKVYAHLYIDDKQVGGLPAWTDIYEYIRQKEEEYQQSITKKNEFAQSWVSIKEELPRVVPFLTKDVYGKIAMNHVSDYDFLRSIDVVCWRYIEIPNE
jgi:hypothetical protein